MDCSLDNKRGSVLVLFAVSVTMIFVITAIVLDLGYIALTKSELQNAADSAALAGVLELIDEDAITRTFDQSDDVVDARDVSQSYSLYNKAASKNVALDRNDINAEDGGIVVGYIDDPVSLDSAFETANLSRYNSVKVTAKRAPEINGMLDLMLGSFSGMDKIALQSTAVASIEDRVVGFDVNGDGTLDMLPFSIFVDAWDAVYDPDFIETETCPIEVEDNYSIHDGVVFKNCSDGIPEIKLYPNKEAVCGLPAAPGNFGTIDLGQENNSTDDIRRQIVEGISENDLVAMGGMILSDPDGDGIFTKWVDGDAGVSTSIRSPLMEIKGQPRLLPLHRDLVGTGDNAQYELCRFVGVAVVDVKMTGALENRHIIVQPAQVIEAKAIIDPEAPHSDLIYAVSLTR